MIFSNVLFSADVILAIAVFAVLAVVEPFLEQLLHDAFDQNPPFQWGWDFFFAPFLRALMIVIFVALAYPAIFGLSVAPTVGELVGGEFANPNGLLGVLFLVGLLVPMVPVLNRHPEFVLPVQGVLATAFLFFWMCAALSVTTVTVWPGIDAVLFMILVSFVGHRVAQKVGLWFGKGLDRAFETRGLDVVLVHAVELLVQIPVILIYGASLGMQISM